MAGCRGPLHTLGSLVGKGASVKFPHQLRGRGLAGGAAGVSQLRARGCLAGLRTGRGAAGRVSPPPRQATGVSPHPGRCPWLPPRPQLLLPGLGYPGRPRRLRGLRGAARRLRRLPPGRGFVSGGLPGLRCGGPGPGGADSLQAPPLPRLLLRAAAPLQAPAPPRPPLRLPRLPPAAAAPASPG